MRDEWDFYFTNVNDNLASIFVNLGIRKEAPDETRPCLNWVFVYMNQPRDDGFSTSAEGQVIQSIEDMLIERMWDELRAVHVGRITTDGRREMYFYADVADEFRIIASNLLAGFPDYCFDCGSKLDAEWTQYWNVLYPSLEDYQRISNRHVIESLERHGDSLTRQRRVDHWAYFSSPIDRSQFAEKIIAAGFNVVQIHDLENPSDKDYLSIQIERVDHVDWQSINDVTIALIRLAQSANGTYDGWETSVEKDG